MNVIITKLREKNSPILFDHKGKKETTRKKCEGKPKHFCEHNPVG